MPEPIKFFAWPTPNGKKIAIMLEECGLPYEIIPTDITSGDQHKEAFLKLNLNGKIPVIVDPIGPGGQALTVFESGAILVYLAEKTGRFLPPGGRARTRVFQWLMWQMGGFGPMLGQAHHFRHHAPEKIVYALDRYTNEARRLYQVLNARLSKVPYVGGQNYSIADMAIYPWAMLSERQGVDIGKTEHVSRWIQTISDRPAVHRGMNFMIDVESSGKRMSDETRKILFGA